MSDALSKEDVLQLAVCPKCGLEAKTLLHPFCQHADCPVLKALGHEPMGGMLESIVNPTKPLPTDEHEHDWVDAAEGPEVVGKVCAICGAEQEPEDFDDNYF